MIVVVFVFLTSGLSSAQEVSMREKITPVGYGRIISVNAFNHTVNYNGTEFIMNLYFYGNRTIDYVEKVGNYTIVPVYDTVDIGLNETTYIYHLTFFNDGISTYNMYLSDGSSRSVLFNVTGTGYEYVDGDMLDMLELGWAYMVDATEEISAIMGAEYENTPEGHNDAVADTIDDSRALREGPVVFGMNMAFGLVMLFANPFSIIWLIIIIAYFVTRSRKESEVLRRIDEDFEDVDVDTAELAVSSRIVRARNQATLSSIKNIAPHLGVSAVIWRDIHFRFTTIASMLAAFDDSEFTDDGRIEGPIADALTTWVRNSLTLEQRSRIQGTYRAPGVEDYLDAMRKILQYVSSHLHLPNYEQYIHKLNDSEEWLLTTIKDLRPGGNEVFETSTSVGTPDFSEMIKNV